jgi:hypothetical protein
MMMISAAQMIVKDYGDVHRKMLMFLKKLSDEELRWTLPTGSLSIAWHGWHVARWEDHLQAAIPGMTPELEARLGTGGVQLWHSEGVADRWGFQADELGYAETGMQMADAVAWAMRFPAKDGLLNYVERVFATATQTVETLSDAEFMQIEQPQDMTEGIWGESTVGDAVFEHVTHTYRHLGMMEALLGMQGRSGTATE